jgi:hypothetical protein
MVSRRLTYWLSWPKSKPCFEADMGEGREIEKEKKPNQKRHSDGHENEIGGVFEDGIQHKFVHFLISLII